MMAEHTESVDRQERDRAAETIRLYLEGEIPAEQARQQWPSDTADNAVRATERLWRDLRGPIGQVRQPGETRSIRQDLMRARLFLLTDRRLQWPRRGAEHVWRLWAGVAAVLGIGAVGLWLSSPARLWWALPAAAAWLVGALTHGAWREVQLHRQTQRNQWSPEAWPFATWDAVREVAEREAPPGTWERLLSPVNPEARRRAEELMAQYLDNRIRRWDMQRSWPAPHEGAGRVQADHLLQEVAVHYLPLIPRGSFHDVWGEPKEEIRQVLARCRLFCRSSRVFLPTDWAGLSAPLMVPAIIATYVIPLLGLYLLLRPWVRMAGIGVILSAAALLITLVVMGVAGRLYRKRVRRELLYGTLQYWPFRDAEHLAAARREVQD
jgi:hypothetical protein